MPDEMLIPIRLAKEGFGGTPQQIAEMRVDWVIGALQYSSFLSKYDETVAQLNSTK